MEFMMSKLIECWSGVMELWNEKSAKIFLRSETVVMRVVPRRNPENLEGCEGRRPENK